MGAGFTHQDIIGAEYRLCINNNRVKSRNVPIERCFAQTSVCGPRKVVQHKYDEGSSEVQKSG